MAGNDVEHTAGRKRRLWVRGVWVAVLGLLLCGCTAKNVTLNVDVASFLDADDRSGHYRTPANSPAVDHDLEPMELRIDGYDQLSAATEVTLDMEVVCDNVSGRGQGRFIVFLADSTAGLFASTPVAVIEAPMAPLTQSTGSMTVQGDARVLELFRRRHMWIGVRLHWEPLDATALEGDYTITRLHAQVLTSVDLL